jgi:hypothetical protein
VVRNKKENIIYKPKFNNTMKKYSIKTILASLSMAFIFTACDKDDTTTPPAPIAQFEISDQMARPAINTVFVDASEKDKFNTTTPSQMSGVFGAKFKARLLALNSAYTTNALGQNADAISGLLVTDVLNVSTTGVTSFFDGTNVLTGRALADDVIDTELLLIFGGPAGASNPTLTKDNVNANDKAFLNSFPYLASPW